MLQVLDAGRLTDGRNQTADFSETVVVMTSNLGSDRYTHNGPGFVNSPDDRGAVLTDVTRSLEQTFAPEFLNRLDHIAHFGLLDWSTMQRIVDRQLGRAAKKLAKRGYDVRFSDDVREAVVTWADRPDFGARQLERLVEDVVLTSAVEQHPGRLIAELPKGQTASPQITWVAR